MMLLKIIVDNCVVCYEQSFSVGNFPELLPIPSAEYPPDLVWRLAL